MLCDESLWTSPFPLKNSITPEEYSRRLSNRVAIFRVTPEGREGGREGGRDSTPDGPITLDVTKGLKHRVSSHRNLRCLPARGPSEKKITLCEDFLRGEREYEEF